jgi:Zn finger protein HypA/HybF involved in hydrogenase expression
MTSLAHAVLASAVVVIVGLAYALTCRVWPYGSCRRCSGTGKLRSPFGRDAARYCPRCKHTGLRLRAGRRLWPGWRDLHRDIHR